METARLCRLTACVAGAGLLVLAMIGAAPPVAVAGAPVTLSVVVSDWTTPEFRDFVKKTYEAENRHVTVNWQGMAFRPLFETIEIQMGAESPEIDVLGVDVPLVASYGIRNYLHPLDSSFSKDDQNEWLPEAREAATFNGKLIAPPGRTSTQMLYYNKKLFKEAGVEFPGADPAKRWTWEQVADAAKKLTRDTNNDGKPDVWGIIFHQVSRPYQMLALPESAGGGNGVSADGLTVRGQLTNAGWVRALKYYSDLFNAWKVAPTGVAPEATQELFLAGRVAMIVTGDWGLALFKKAQFDWGVAPHPYFQGGKPVTPTGSWHWGVSAFSRNKEEAAKLIRFVTLDKRAMDFLFDKLSRLPAHKQILGYTPQQIQTLGFPKEGYELIKYELKNTARHRPKTPGYLEWEDILTATFEDVRNGAKPEDALRKAEARIQGQLLKYRR
jgi:ABC-type glycerol-3-phosphate transport system substrate-binding protein